MNKIIKIIFVFVFLGVVFLIGSVENTYAQRNDRRGNQNDKEK